MSSVDRKRRDELVSSDWPSGLGRASKSRHGYSNPVARTLRHGHSKRCLASRASACTVAVRRSPAFSQRIGGVSHSVGILGPGFRMPRFRTDVKSSTRSLRCSPRERVSVRAVRWPETPGNRSPERTVTTPQRWFGPRPAADPARSRGCPQSTPSSFASCSAARLVTVKFSCTTGALAKHSTRLGPRRGSQ